MWLFLVKFPRPNLEWRKSIRAQLILVRYNGKLSKFKLTCRSVVFNWVLCLIFGFQFSIAAINDTESISQWEPLAPTKEAQVNLFLLFRLIYLCCLNYCLGLNGAFLIENKEIVCLLVGTDSRINSKEPLMFQYPNCARLRSKKLV